MRRSMLVSAIGLGCLIVSSRAGATPPAQRLLVSVPASATVSATNSVESARALLVRHAAIPGHVSLAADRTFALRGATVYRFDQVHLGVPVYARGAGVAVDDRGHVIVATSRIEDNLPSSVTPTISAAQAATIATDFAAVSASERQARLVVVPMPGGARLAWMVHTSLALPELYAPVVTVDASTGRVVASVNAVRFKNQAKVFPTNPVEDNGVTQLATLPVGDGKTTPDNDDIVSYNCVDNGTLLDAGGRSRHVCDLVKNAVADPATGDFTQYDPAGDSVGGDAFAQLSLFYHATKAFAYYRSFDGNGGFKLAASDTPLFAVANWMTAGRGAGGGRGDAGTPADAGLTPLRPYQNAGYMPFTPGAAGATDVVGLYPNLVTGGVMEFGQGAAADYSYDGEVVYHEFTHAVVNATINLVPYWHLDAQGAMPSPGAINEGLADFFSASISGKTKLGTYAVKDMQSAGVTGDCIRDLATTNVCPRDVVGEVHTDSLFFTGALWKVRSALADDTAKKLFTQTMFTVMTATKSGDVGYEDVAGAFVAALEKTMGATTSKAMQDEFTARGILPTCDRVIDYKGTAIRGTDPLLANTLVASGMMYFNMTVPYAPSHYQVHIPLAAGTQQLTATFKALGGGFGGGTTQPFAPSFLVNFGAAIKFDLKNGLVANTKTLIAATLPGAASGDAGTDATVDAGRPSGNGSSVYTATITVPDGATDAYVMLVNKGDMETNYIDLAFTTVGGTATDAGVTPMPEAAPPSDAATDAASDAGATGATAEGGGCSCRSVPSSSGSGALGLLVAFAAWLLRRKARV